VKLSESEKQQLIKEAFGANYHTVGNRLPALRSAIDALSDFNDAASIAELLPLLGRWLSIPAVSTVASNASFLGILAFPVVQSVNLINANETGLRLYSYRATAYCITAWAFNRPQPMSSPEIKSRLSEGPIVATNTNYQRYNTIWLETVSGVTSHLNSICINNRIDISSLKKLFCAAARNKPDQLSLLVLKEFESKVTHTVLPIWKSNYKVLYPR